MSIFWQSAYAAWGDTTDATPAATSRGPYKRGAKPLGRRPRPQTVRALAILREVGPAVGYQQILPRLVAEDAVIDKHRWAHLRRQVFGEACVNLVRGKRRTTANGGWERVA